ncbi:hypothetical protein N2152v2_008372 [Parachlorella kessleri]
MQQLAGCPVGSPIRGLRTASHHIEARQLRSPRRWLKKALVRASDREFSKQPLLDLDEVVVQRSKELDEVSSPPLELPPVPGQQWWDSLGWVPGLRRLAQFVSETFLVARLAVKLFGYVGFGSRWICSFLQLLAYAGFLLPGFLQMVYFYYRSPTVRRGLRYGPESRNVCDLYFPAGHSQGATGSNKAGGSHRPLPVLVYVTGGAWVIGYKAWGALLARRLSEAGVLVVALDYQNFPQGTALDMLRDINQGMNWVFDNIAGFGGDPSQVYLCGQSCGGHLASLAVLTQAEQQGLGLPVPGGSPAWDVRRVKAFVGVSGVYNVHDLVDHFDRRGLYKKVFLQIMSIHGTPQLKLLSPVYVAAHSLQKCGPRSTPSSSSSSSNIVIDYGMEGAGSGTDVVSDRLLQVQSVVAAKTGDAVDGGSTETTAELEPCGDSAADLIAADWGQGGKLSAGLASADKLGEQLQRNNQHAQSASSLYGSRASHGSDSSTGGGSVGPSSSGVVGATQPLPSAGDGPDRPELAAAAGDGPSAEEPCKTPAELMPQMLLLHGDSDRMG